MKTRRNAHRVFKYCLIVKLESNAEEETDCVEFSSFVSEELRFDEGRVLTFREVVAETDLVSKSSDAFGAGAHWSSREGDACTNAIEEIVLRAVSDVVVKKRNASEVAPTVEVSRNLGKVVPAFVGLVGSDSMLNAERGELVKSSTGGGRLYQADSERQIRVFGKCHGASHSDDANREQFLHYFPSLNS